VVLLVIALGGNAILKKGERGSPEEQWNNVLRAAKALANIVVNENKIIITHGNGPQVGYLAEAVDSISDKVPPQTLDILVAMTQGWLGYLIQHALQEELRRRNVKRDVVTVVTRVVVDKNDPGFKNPTKYIGRYYEKEEAERIAKERGWVFKPDPRGGYRRVVPSPMPIDVLESDVIAKLAREGVIVIAVGGGGIPVIKENNTYRPIEAVIDKDLASSVLAVKVRADKFIILTDVEGVALNYGKPNEIWLKEVYIDDLERYYKEGHFPPGSMGPKVLAAINFVKKTNKVAIIGSLEQASEVINEKSGTLILPRR
jgi:carbamate kinase